MSKTLGEKLKKLAEQHSDYDRFRVDAMKIIPEEMKKSIGAHLLEMYVEFRYEVDL